MITIAPAAPEHHAALHAIAAATLGPDYLQDHAWHNTHVALAGTDCMGFVQYHLLPQGQLYTALPHLPPRPTFAKATAALLHNIAVAPAWQRQGVGLRLVQHAVQACRAQGATLLLAEAWQHGTPPRTNVGTVLTAAGFLPCGTAPHYWRSACDAGQFECPARTTGCACSAVFYYKEWP